MIGTFAPSTSKWRFVILVVAAFLALSAVLVFSPAPAVKAECSISCTDEDWEAIYCGGACGDYVAGAWLYLHILDCETGVKCYTQIYKFCDTNCEDVGFVGEDGSYVALNASGDMPATETCPLPGTLIAFNDAVLIT